MLFQFRLTLLVALSVLMSTSAVVSAQPDAAATTTIAGEAWQYHFGPVPDWVEAIQQKTNVPISGDALQTLIFDRQVRVQADGSESTYIHVRQRVNNSSGLSSAGRLEILVQPSYEQLDIHDYRLIRDGESQSVFNPEKVELLRQEGELSSSIYTGSLTVLQILEGLQVGDIIEYRFTRHGRNPVLGERYSDQWSMGWDVDVALAQLRLLLPAQRQFTIRSHPSLPQPRQSREGEYQVHQWLVKDYSGHNRPGDMPAWYFAYPLVEVSEYQSWAEVAQWGHGLFDEALNQNLDWPAANKIIEDRALNGGEKAVALVHLVQQDIRYFGIETGVNALRPSMPLETVDRRYGDCKDKTVVLTRLLRQAGIEAYSVLVSARRERGVHDLLPGPHTFDHAIVMAHIDGRSYWFDPTATHQGESLENIGFIDYGYALVLDDQNGELTAVAAPGIVKDSIEVQQHFISDSDGLRLDMNWLRQGRVAENARYNLAGIGQKEWDKNINSYYERLYAGLQANGSTQHDDDPMRNEYRTQHHYRITEPLKLVGTHWRLETFADNVRDYTQLPAVLSREEPLAWAFPLRVVQDIEVSHDDGLEPFDYESVSIEREAFSYRREVLQEDGRLSIHHEYIARADHVPVEQLSAHLEGLREVNEALSLYVYLNSPEEQRLNQRNESLKNKLRDLLKKN